MIRQSRCTYAGCGRAWERVVVYEDTDDVDLLCAKHYRKLTRLEYVSKGGVVGFVGGVLGL